MRVMHLFLMAGALFLAIAFAHHLYTTFDGDGNDSVSGLFLFGTPLFPAMMGLVLIVAGFAAGLTGRVSAGRQYLAGTRTIANQLV